MTKTEQIRLKTWRLKVLPLTNLPFEPYRRLVARSGKAKTNW